MRKKLKKWVIPLVISIFLFVYLIVSIAILIFKPQKEYLINTIGQLDAKTTYELFEKEDRQTPLEFKDYMFYGESLNLYSETYQQNNVIGKYNEIKFVDWLNTENVVSFKIGEKIDEGIDLSQLNDGFYSVYVKEDDLDKRLYYQNDLNVEFYTVTRNDEKKLIKLICDPNYFHIEEDETEETILDYAYLYVEVTTVTNNGQYDVVISVDPAMTTNIVSAVGYSENGLIEQNELLDVANIIKQDLEAKGLKVLVLNCSVDNIDHLNDVLFYETDSSNQASILEQIYASRAKYMLHLDLDELRNPGFVHYSNYASNAFANTVYQQVQLANLDGDLGACFLGENNDYTYEIRETGGKALSAATYSESAMKNTFAYNNIYGLNTIEVSYGNILSSLRMQRFIENKEALAHYTANGIINYLYRNYVTTSE